MNPFPYHSRFGHKVPSDQMPGDLSAPLSRDGGPGSEGLGAGEGWSDGSHGVGDMWDPQQGWGASLLRGFGSRCETLRSDVNIRDLLIQEGNQVGSQQGLLLCFKSLCWVQLL